jgi:hypothetical protein
MSPFEELYGRKCNTPISWDNPDDRAVVGPELLREMEEQMSKINNNLKVSQDRKKIYDDKGIHDREFIVGDHLFLKVRANKSFLKLGKCSNLASRYCGSFEIIERIGHVYCMIALPTSMSIHNVFHVSLLKKYIHDASNVTDWNVIQVEQEVIEGDVGSIEEEEVVQQGEGIR